MSIPESSGNNEELEFESLDEVMAKRESPSTRTTGQQIQRQTGRGLQRTGEVLYGMPGDLINAVRQLNNIIEGGRKPEEELNWLQKYGRKFAEAVPTSADLRARSAEVRPELEPETQTEDIVDEVWSDTVSLFAPNIGGKGTALGKLGRAMGISMAANSGKEVVKAFGGGDNAQELAKMGTMLFTSMFGKGRGINTKISQLYKKAKGSVPEGEKFIYNTSKLNQLEKVLKKGSVDSSKEPVLKIIEEIKSKTPEGKMLVDEGVEFDKSINRAISRSFNDKSLRGNLKQLKKAHAGSLENYAKENPEWAESWKEAKEMYQGIAKSQDIQNYLKKNANLKNISHASLVLGMGGAALPGPTAAKLGTAGGVAASIYMSEIAKRLATNPALRRYYGNVINAALSENKGSLLRNLNGLERVAKKEFQENPFPDFEISEEEIIKN